MEEKVWDVGDPIEEMDTMVKENGQKTTDIKH
jgi:hypothetical protein